MSQPKSNVPFGFQDIAPEEKTRKVQELFNRVAENYDLMNDLMSGGMHRLWKRQMIQTLAPRPGMKILDVAGGTGDIAFGILKAEPKVNVTVCDLTPGMLTVGMKRAKASMKPALKWICGDAASLPFTDHSVDAYTIAFGLRNVTEMQTALAEAHRILKPGGRFLCLEFSRVQYPVLNELYEKYAFGLIPKIGAWVAQDEAAYQYLVESIARFPPQEELKQMLMNAGFYQVSYSNLSGGIAALHGGWKI
ncbi:MAG: bifunctional demethylmenaquinone methyltransferase/2-methoxy-6-polyprenyl-1,4-benzoquinol methylase UbiE [Pseudomonadota bacterium]